MDNSKDEAIKAMYESTEDSIKHMAFCRHVLKTLGEDGEVEEFDKKMNEWCEKYYDYFKDMDRAAMFEYMIKEELRMILEGEIDG